MPVYSLLLVCVLPIQSAHEAAGAAGTRHSPRPPWGRKINANLGRIARRGRRGASYAYECVKFSAVVARESGRSSIPETPIMEARSHGVLVTPLSRSMTVLARSDVTLNSDAVIPGWSEGPDPESRDSPMCNCTSEVRAGARPGMTSHLTYSASSTAFAISTVPLLPP